MKAELNPKIETLFLISINQWGEKDKNIVIEELDNIGVEGADFYNQYFRTIEKYYGAFQKHRVDSPGARLVQEMDGFLLSLYADIFYSYPDWVEKISTMPEDEISKEINPALDSMVEGESDLITALDSMGLSAETKWQIMVLKQTPKKQLEMVASAIMENLPAFEKAREKMSGELEVLLENVNKVINDPGKVRLLHLSHKVSPDAQIIPTLALPVAVLVTDNAVFYGVLGDKLASFGAEFTKEELLVGAKALSEKSKLEILLSIKDTSLYSLEIAEKVGLTAATVSHHMSSLLTTGFVEVKRGEGKVYYQLVPKGIERFLSGVGQLLL